MATSPTPQYTDFSKDVLGRYVCNGLDEALASTTAPGGRPFDIVVLGGGSFGGALAQHVLYGDRFRNHRVLVLEAGPFLLAEHFQNLPTLGLNPPPPTTTDPGVPRAEVWGLPWRSDVTAGFPGLAYCIGGRSLFWGGWSPRLLDTPTDTEMARSRWPEAVVSDLNDRFFAESAEQIGVTETNDFVFGAMHETLRQRLFDHHAEISEAIPLGDLPLHLNVPPGLPKTQRRMLRLEAPLAVQGRASRSGFFPINKFSSVPLLIRAARQAWNESGGDDAKKRLMVVPNCHATWLETDVTDGTGVVRAIHTNLGVIPLPERGVVVLAAGTIESTRLALVSFGASSGASAIGGNLIAHLRSNYTIRIPRSSLGLDPSRDLQASALFLKCRHTFGDGSHGYYHLQITAAGIKGIGTNSEAELFQKMPDVDSLADFRQADEDSVVITLRGIGEMQADNPASHVVLGGETDEFGVPRAFVQFGNPKVPATPGESPQTAKDRELWDAMDATARKVRDIFALGGGFTDVAAQQRDGLGTTHHEAGTLRFGIDPGASVTTPNGRFHHVVNAYAIGPALLPTIGSPNPMLSGVALARRMAEHLVAPKAPPALETGFESLFDGTAASLAIWQQIGPGSFDLVAGENVLTARPGSDWGLLLYGAEAFANFVLRLQVRIDRRDDNSGIFVRSRDPRLPAPDLGPTVVENPARIAALTGFEAQIDELARPDGADLHRTGAVYGMPIGNNPAEQRFQRGSSLQPGEWNDVEIEVVGGQYTVRWNGFVTSVFGNANPNRGVSPGFLGIQVHTGAVSYRAIRLRRL